MDGLQHGVPALAHGLAQPGEMALEAAFGQEMAHHRLGQGGHRDVVDVLHRGQPVQHPDGGDNVAQPEPGARDLEKLPSWITWSAAGRLRQEGIRAPMKRRSP